jgi:hypothetical protein
LSTFPRHIDQRKCDQMMTGQSTCPLCASVATVQAREDAWHVACPPCLRFTLDPYLMDLFRDARQREDARVLRLLPRLSDAARRTAAKGGRLTLVADNWHTVASDAAPHDA